MAVTGPRIEITIAKNGETDTKVFGVEGASCRTLSAPWESLFGGVIATADTTEAFEDPELVEVKGKQQ